MSLDVVALIVVSAVVALSAFFAMKHKRKVKPLESASKENLETKTAEKIEKAIEEETPVEPVVSPEENTIVSVAGEMNKEVTEKASVDIEVPFAEEGDEAPITSSDEELVSLSEGKDEQEEAVLISASDKVEQSLNAALANTKKGFWGKIQSFFGAGGVADWDSIEEVLYTSDLGPRTVQHLLEKMEDKLSGSDKNDQEKVRQAIKDEMINILSEVQGEDEEQLAGLEYELLDDNDEVLKPVVWMIVGINGSGKTTSIGKLAHILSEGGKQVMLAAGDTFRAAADAQLKAWSERAGVELFSPENVKDPSAVAFDACKSAVSKGYDHVIVDTAGRLHTQKNLMEELKKMKRVVDKAIPGAPHEVILVVDGNNGQNALIQAKEFNEAVDLTGVILTKMDGSAKGGVVLGVAHELALPIKRIGVGEKIQDLRSFDSKEFVDAII